LPLPVNATSPLGYILRRDQIIGLAALFLFIAFAWWYLLQGAGMPEDMSSMSGMEMEMEMIATIQEWTAGYAWIVFMMWWIMMIAMMLPSAAPMILLHGLVARHRQGRGATVASHGIFLLGYLAVWGAFSALATALQWQLQSVALMSAAMKLSSAVLGGAILAAAGIYQLTPFRDACLQHCRGPMEFLMRHWMPGSAGAWKMGIRHGLYCLGCCWMLMTLLFYGGVMNLYWIIALACYVLIEKLAPRGQLVSRITGIMLIGWGMFVLAGAARIGV
jgi:predicted metal-binding membrane protein